MSPKYKYDREDRIRAMNLYESGMSCKEVESVTGIHAASVRNWARQKGVIRPRNTSSLTDKQKEEIKYLYLSRKHSRRQVAKEMGISQWKVYNYLKKKDLIRNKSEARTASSKRRYNYKRSKSWN
jgi:DNA-binding CsgD family transcriptional regulator